MVTGDDHTVAFTFRVTRWKVRLPFSFAHATAVLHYAHYAGMGKNGTLKS